MSLETLEEVRIFFAKDKFATDNGAVIDEIGDHYAKCSMKLGERHKNAVGAVMGGVYFTLADFAFAIASNRQNMGVVSLNSNIAYLGAVRGNELIAEASCIKEGRHTCFYKIDISDELDNLVAVVNTTGYRKTM